MNMLLACRHHSTHAPGQAPAKSCGRPPATTRAELVWAAGRSGWLCSWRNTRLTLMIFKNLEGKYSASRIGRRLLSIRWCINANVHAADHELTRVPALSLKQGTCLFYNFIKAGCVYTRARTHTRGLTHSRMNKRARTHIHNKNTGKLEPRHHFTHAVRSFPVKKTSRR